MNGITTLVSTGLSAMALSAAPLSAAAMKDTMPDGSAAADAADDLDTPEVKAALACLDAYLKTFNERDDAGFDATFNFPTYRLAAGEVTVQPAGQTNFDAFRQTKPDWAYSEWASRKIIQAGPDKVHIAATLARYRADGTLVTAFDSLYVITRQDGHWGIKIRSSYAPR